MRRRSPGGGRAQAREERAELGVEANARWQPSSARGRRGGGTPAVAELGWESEAGDAGRPSRAATGEPVAEGRQSSGSCNGRERKERIG